MKKTFLQKIFSFFGFWSYKLHIGNDECYEVIYWCCLPWGKFYRKFDLFRIDISKTDSLNAQKQYLRKRFEELGEELPPWLVKVDS
jgi:predicted metal-binding transcription factor (methanogenesis marker protein 9)